MPGNISSNLIPYKMNTGKNTNIYNLIFLVFLILLLICLIFIIIDNFFIHQSISEFLNLNKELYEKFEHFEMIQQEKIKNLDNVVNKNLEEIATNQKIIKKKINDPTPTEWGFVAGTLVLCFYVIIKLSFGK